MQAHLASLAVLPTREITCSAQHISYLYSVKIEKGHLGFDGG